MLKILLLNTILNNYLGGELVKKTVTKITPFLLAGLVLTCVDTTITANAAPDNDVTYTEPYLLTLDPDSEMNICWLTYGNGNASIEIGETDALGQTITAQEYQIRGLRTSATMEGYDDEPLNNPELTVYQQIATPLYPEQEYTKGGKHWYSVDYGDLHISNISCFRWQNWDGFEAPGWAMFDDISPNSAQVNWLMNDLASTDAKYKWVNMHWHMLNRGEDGYYPVSQPVIDGNKATYPEGDYAYNVLKPIYEMYNVDAVSFGHSHVYERYLINGVNYIEAASIGNNYRDVDDPYHPSGNLPIAEKNDIRSFMLLTKNENGILAQGIAASGDTKGQVFDAFYVTK